MRCVHLAQLLSASCAEGTNSFMDTFWVCLRDFSMLNACKSTTLISCADLVPCHIEMTAVICSTGLHVSQIEGLWAHPGRLLDNHFVTQQDIIRTWFYKPNRGGPNHVHSWYSFGTVKRSVDMNVPRLFRFMYMSGWDLLHECHYMHDANRNTEQ